MGESHVSDKRVPVPAERGVERAIGAAIEALRVTVSLRLFPTQHKPGIYPASSLLTLAGHRHVWFLDFLSVFFYSLLSGLRPPW